MIQMHQLKYVLKIQECGSYSKAAKALYITQPTLSQQIKVLEQELNVKLFNRHQKGISLTDAGENFVFHARRMLAEMELLLGDMRSYAFHAQGKIKIGLLWVFTDLGIARILSSFQNEYPEIETVLTVDGSKKLMELLQKRELDAVFVIGSGLNLNSEQFHTVKLYDGNMVVALPAGHPLTAREVLDVTDLNHENIILPAQESSIYEPIMEQFSARGIKPKIVARNSQTSVTIACVADGVGLAFVSDALAGIYSGERVVTRPLVPTIKREVFYVTFKEMLAIPTIALFTEYLEHSQTLISPSAAI